MCGASSWAVILPMPAHLSIASNQTVRTQGPTPAECHELSCSVMRCHDRHAPADALPFLHRVPFSSIPSSPLARRQSGRTLCRAYRAHPPARVSAGAVRAPDCACARTREAGPGRTSPAPRKGAENPTGRARRRVLVAVHGMEHNANNMRFQPLRGKFSGATDSSRRMRRAVPGYCRPISFASVSNRRRQAGQRFRTVSGSISRSKSLAWPILR